MRETICAALALVAAAGAALSVLGQVGQDLSAAVKKESFTHRSMPYTAKYRETWVRKLADGRTRTTGEISAEARNSQGLSMHSQTIILPTGDPAPTTYFLVGDLAQTRTSWSVMHSGEKGFVAHRATVVHPFDPDRVRSCAAPAAASTPSAIAAQAKPAPGEPPTNSIQQAGAALPAKPTPDDPTARVHQAFDALRAELRAKPPGQDGGDLGTKRIKGIEVRGFRSITTIPTGTFGIGNTEPFERTFEEWHDTTHGLEFLTVLQVIDDPQVHFTRELESFTLGDPDPALFQPPADYEIVDEEVPGCPAVGVGGAKPQARQVIMHAPAGSVLTQRCYVGGGLER
jgi:hypothetical protein